MASDGPDRTNGDPDINMVEDQPLYSMMARRMRRDSVTSVSSCPDYGYNSFGTITASLRVFQLA